MTNNELKELEKYARLEFSEIGECVEMMLRLRTYSELSEEFLNSVDKELKFLLDDFKKNCRINTRAVTRTTLIEELEWII